MADELLSRMIDNVFKTHFLIGEIKAKAMIAKI